VRRSLLLLVTVVAALLPACAGLLDTAAAVVNDDKVEEDQFRRELDFLLADPRFASQIPQGEAGDVQRKELSRRYLTFVIHQQLVEQYAGEHDIEADPAEVDGLFQDQVAQIGGPQAFARLLQETGTSESDVRHLIQQQALRQEVAEAVVADRVSDDELQQTYEDRALEFSQVHVAHILVGSKAEAKRIARQATPQNFAALARRSSEDEGTASNGGDLGTQRAADLVGPFARASLRIPVGEVGGPVETEFGFHVIHVIERETQPFEEVREQLLEEVRGDLFTQWLFGRLQLAEIRVNPRYGYFDRDSGAVLERTSTSPEPRPSVQLDP
jgi:parvulin-like peptidyl-prolyl isomerase